MFFFCDACSFHYWSSCPVFGIALTLLVMLGRFTVFGFLPRTLYVEMINTYITKGDTEKTLLDEKC